MEESGPVGGVIQAGIPLPYFTGFPNIGDFNEDGWLEPFGFLNNGDGTFSTSPSAQINAILAAYPGRVNRDARILDVDGDGHQDAVWNVYSDPSIANSFTLVLFGDGTGAFTRVEEWQDVDGYGETIVAADFNNDGLTDLFLPVYTHVDGSDSNYLFLNEGGGVFGENVAQEWGVGLSFLPAQYRVEGAQAADVNFDGKIDLFVGSHLFINEGDGFSAQALDTLIFDEGSNLFDYDNDGDFDLVLRGLNLGPRLFESVDGQFIDRGILSGTETILGFGLNVADLDGNGWQDILVGGDGCISVFFNFEGTFTRYLVASNVGEVPEGTVTFGEAPCCGICDHGGPGVCEALAVADFDHDGTLDILSRAGTLVYFENDLEIGDVFGLTVLSATGVQDQFGRSVMLTPWADPTIHMARSVESGSGYLSQSQYEMLIGLPVAGAYDVEIAFANGPYSFVAAANQDVSAYADGRVSITGSGDADIMGGGQGADTLSAGGGDDTILGSAGADAIDGGTGTDAIDYSALTAGIVANLVTGTVDIGPVNQTVASIEDLIGTAFADILLGTSGANHLEGGNGDDNINGGPGADTMAGGTGNDIYFVDNAADVVTELAGEGVDEIRTSRASLALTGNVENLTGLVNTGQSLTGNALDNQFAGGTGADTFTGGSGNDRYLIGAGDTVIEQSGGGNDLILTSVNYILPLGVHVENLSTSDWLATTPINIAGNALANVIVGNAGANVLNGDGGADILQGLGGNDTYIVDHALDRAFEAAGGGTDTIRTKVSFALAAGQSIEVLMAWDLAGTSALTFTGNELANTLIGNAGANEFFGGGGADILRGNGGDDRYYIDQSATQLIEANGGGNDILLTSVNYTLAEGVYIESLSTRDWLATTAINITGNSLANVIVGNAGANVLTGGGGADILEGREGNDRYVVDNGGVTVVEAAGGGDDEVATALASYVLPANVERLTATSSTAQLLTGNTLNNIFGGGSGGDTFAGGLGNDLYLLNVGDTVVELAGEGFDEVRTALAVFQLDANVERLTGIGPGAQHLSGNSGANEISGGAAADTFEGGGGNDIYFVGLGDTVVEALGGGTDEVRTSLQTYTLAANVENLTGTSSGGQKLVGNELGNVLRANASLNTLIGRGGDDTYWINNSQTAIVEQASNGYDTIRTSVDFLLDIGISIEVIAAADELATSPLSLTGNALVNTLIGNAGDNLLNGVAGADTYVGLGGNDRFIIDSAGITVVEAAGGGNDLILTSVNYVLPEGVHVEKSSTRDWSATTPVNITGNSLANVIVGNAGANVLTGGGADILQGREGNDRYYVDSSATQLSELNGGGNDILLTSVSYTLAEGVYIESLSTRDWLATTAINITGNSLANVIVGNAGANVLTGGGGADALQGRGGNDTFTFNSGLGAGNIDAISDFASGADLIALENAVFAGLGVGALPASAFVIGSAAADADDRIVYNSATGALFFDPDGSGAQAAVLFATLQGAPTLLHSDFVVT